MTSAAPSDAAWDPFAPSGSETAPEPVSTDPDPEAVSVAEPVSPAAESAVDEASGPSTDTDPEAPAGAGANHLPVRRPGALAIPDVEQVQAHRDKASQYAWSFVDLSAEDLELPEEAVGLLKAQVARTYNAVPVAIDGRKAIIAVENPTDAITADALRPHLQGYTMRLVYADPVAIRRLINKSYSASAEAQALARQSQQRDRDRGRESEATDMGRIADSQGSEIVKVLRLTIEQALRDGASDIHIEPTKSDLVIRYRIDGKMFIASRYPRVYERSLLTKIKVDARMHTDNFLVPDSGVLQYQMTKTSEPVDIRVEIAPTTWGSVCTMRLQQNIWRPLGGLGFSEVNERRYRQALDQPFGLILATGPTGSGKSTTLYASVREQISPTTKIITLENPVEFKVPEGVTQIMVNEQQGMTFAGGLRSILRQDPDIILVGEIRDRETAETAIDAAMTGHQVFSTLHTNDAPEIIARLIRMGIEPFMLSSSLLAALGQRLVGRLCMVCRISRRITKDQARAAGFDPDALTVDTVYEANTEGCNECRDGIAGRLPIHEVLLADDEMTEAIADNAPQHLIREIAFKGGMTTMRHDGWEKVQQGLTSITEVNANTRREF